MVKTLRRPTNHALSEAWVPSGRFGFIYAINSEVPNRSAWSFDLQRVGGEITFPHH
jgi:hypothetical protein